MATSLGVLNPFRYRGYVYDEETGFYYLKSRYYDPETCRFISADVLLSTGQGVLGHNCYAYCLNNPICIKDDGGKTPISTILHSDDIETEDEVGDSNKRYVNDQHDSNIKDGKFGILGSIDNFWIDKKTGDICGHYFTATKNADNTFTLHNMGNNETMKSSDIWDYIKNYNKAQYANSTPVVWGIKFSY